MWWVLVDCGSILLSRTNENPFLSETESMVEGLSINHYIFFSIQVFMVLFMCAATLQHSWMVTFWIYSYFFLFLMVSLSYTNEKLFLKIITFFQFNVLAILMDLKLFDATLYIISSSLCKNFVWYLLDILCVCLGFNELFCFLMQHNGSDSKILFSYLLSWQECY